MPNTSYLTIPAASTALPIRPTRHSSASRDLARPLGTSIAPAARFKVGGVQVAFRRFPAQRAIALTPSESMVYLLVPLEGEVIAVTADDTYETEGGGALLLARPERISCVWQAGSAGYILGLPRAAIQAEASRLFDEPRRLASLVLVFNWVDRPDWLAAPPVDHHRPPSLLLDSGPERQGLLCASLTRAIDAEGLGKPAFPVAKSVLRALQHVRTHPRSAWTVEALAPVAGVTAATLRKNFRACLGLTATQVVRDARLEWVRRQLGSRDVSSSVAQLAEAASFGGAGVMARAYQRKFGETPTQTRSLAFKEIKD